MYYEQQINNFLLNNGVDSIDKLNIRYISEALRIEVCYFPCTSCLIYEEGNYYIILDEDLDSINQYEQFLHELSHYIYCKEFVTIKDFDNWSYIEKKVDALVPYLAIPKFSLEEFRSCKYVSEAEELFGVTKRIIYKRINLIRNKYLKKIS